MTMNFHDILEVRLDRILTCDEARAIITAEHDNRLLLPDAMRHTEADTEFMDNLLKAFAEPLTERDCQCWLSRTVM